MFGGTQPEGEVLLIEKWQHAPCVSITEQIQMDLHNLKGAPQALWLFQAHTLGLYLN